MIYFKVICLRQLFIALGKSGFSIEVSFHSFEGIGSELSGLGCIKGIITREGIFTASPTIIASPVLSEGNNSDRLNEESGIEDFIIP